MSDPSDWEDWDPSQGNFLHHMIAGSVAGIAEHTVMFPVDTLKTHVQCMRECPERMVGQRMLEMVRGQGMLRLWRGVSTMFAGCVPAHALYFSSLEYCKGRFGVNKPGHHPAGAALAGATATVFHDAIMTPMDVIKQRLQLGYYRGIVDCAASVWRTEGAGAFYRSFPTTLFMNIPYGCIMVATNETVKRLLHPDGDFDTRTYVLAGSGAGAVAAAATNPLDVVKTRLQTQALRAYSHSHHHTSSAGAGAAAGPTAGSLRYPYLHNHFGGPGSGLTVPSTAMHSAAARCVKGHCGMEQPPGPTLQYQGLVDAVRQIHAAEGVRGFFRGTIPRLLVHTPSVAISWTTYETAKAWLSDTALLGAA